MTSRTPRPHQPLTSLLPSRSRRELDLSGTWSFALDPEDTGVTERWFDRALPDSIGVPGSWEEQGYGEPAAEFIGGWTKRRSYEGVAWYAREVDVPADWAEDSRLWLQLDRVSWQSTVYVDGKPIATQDSLSTPHLFDLTGAVRPGGRHRVSIRVDNALTGVLNYEGHIHSRHTATTWGGIVGKARLTATPATWIEHLELYPDAKTRSVRVAVRLGGDSEQTARIVVRDQDREIATAEGLEATLELGSDARLWSDRDPFLYNITVELSNGDAVHDRFGLRTFKVDGRALRLNGDKVFLRGYVDCCIFPLTGYPPEDKQVYVDQFDKAKEWGFNHVRLHSWTPGRVFFEAADEAGMLVQSELPSWGNCNSDEYLSQAGEFLSTELERVIPHLQRHPSLVIHSMGNELLQAPPHGAGFRHSPFLSGLVRRGREADPSRVYADQTGFGHVPEEAERETDLSILHTFRGSVPDTTTTWQSKIAGGKTPVIAHEHTQMDMYARFDEIEKFKGIMEPSWLIQAKEGLASKGILDEVDRASEASGALQALCLKELFERLRRTPGLSGVQMLNFTDFPGQGTALNGVLDVFWDEKGHISAEEFRRFNAETVLTCSTPRRTYASGGFFEAELAVSHFGSEPIEGTVRWTLATADGATVASGQEPLSGVRLGHPSTIAVLAVKLPEHGSHQLTLSAAIESATAVAENSWDIWVFDDTRWDGASASIRLRPSIQWLADYYPAMSVDTYDFLRGSREQEPQRQLLLSDRLHVRYVDAVLNGATMIWLAESEELNDSISSHFESLFWSFLWFPEQTNQTMGLTIEDHPLLAGFPHAGRSDWQWYDLVDGARAIGLDAIPHVRPIIGGIDNWNRGKRLAYVFEARVGAGRILVTTLKVLERYHSSPEAVNLLDAMLRYTQSDAFAPSAELSLAQLWSIPKNPIGWSRP